MLFGDSSIFISSALSLVVWGPFFCRSSDSVVAITLDYQSRDRKSRHFSGLLDETLKQGSVSIWSPCCGMLNSTSLTPFFRQE